MVYRRRRGAMARKSSKPRRKYGARKFMRQRKLSDMRTFTECLSAGPINTNNGGVFKTRITDIPQHADYARLYSQFCIRKLKVVLLPRYGSSEPNAALAGLTAVDIQNTRIAFSIDDTPARLNPANEIDVLSNNGAKVVTGHKKVTITCWPRPDLAMFDTNSGAVPAVNTKKSVWLNFNNPETGNNGETIQHGGISYWVTGSSALASYDCYDAYFYVTFSVRDAV